MKNVECYAHTIDLWPPSLLDSSPLLAAESRSTSQDRCAASLGQAEKTFLECVVSSPAVCPAVLTEPAGHFWIPACWVLPAVDGPGSRWLNSISNPSPSMEVQLFNHGLVFLEISPHHEAISGAAMRSLIRTKEPPITQDIPRELGALCQELVTKTKYIHIFIVITQVCYFYWFRIQENKPHYSHLFASVPPIPPGKLASRC